MNTLILSLVTLIDLVFVVFLVLFLVFLTDSLARGHDSPTGKKAIKQLVKAISKHKPEAVNFYDLGCGRGTVALAVKKEMPQLEVSAVDCNAVRIFFANLKSFLLKRRVNFKKQDLFKTKLQNADVVYTYLWYDLMPPLEKKLRDELKSGALVITNTSKFPNWKPVETVRAHTKVTGPADFETLFVYKKE